MSALFFDPKTAWFSEKDTGGCVQITKACKAELMEGQKNGRPVAADVNGNPINVDPPKQRNATIIMERQRAYADPICGSDRFFAEATRMRLSGEPGYEEVQQSGLDRYAEIKNQYPMGDE